MPAAMWFPKVRRVSVAVAAAVAVVSAFPSGAGTVSSVPQTGSGAIVVDGAVNAIVTVGSTVVLGGAFTHAGPYTGNFASVPVGGGTPTSLPVVDGTVNAVVPDGSGGWYIGGSFTSVGSNAISNLVHITSAGAVDAAWVPSPNAEVDALALSGATLYVGGQFSTIGGTSRSNVAAVSAATGTATSWNPNPDSTVDAIAVSGSTVYVAGSFANVGTTARAGLAAISASSGSVTTWNPAPSPAASVTAIAVSPDGNTVYAGGTFTQIGANSASLSRLAAISASTGDASTTWAPAPNNTVDALVLSSDGGTLYVGGTFTLIGSAAQTRNDVAAVSTSDPGNPTSWDPSTVGSSVSALALSSDGGTIYVGGTFTQIGGQSRQDLAAVTTSSSATATSWQEDADASPNALAATSSAVGVGGAISSVGLQSRSRLAAVSTSGTLLDFNPGPNNTVNALAVSPDSSTVYVGGNFTSIGGLSQRYLAAVTLSTGNVTSWSPSPTGAVASLAAEKIGSDVDVYVGQTTGSGSHLVAFLGSSGLAPGAFSPTSLSGNVNALVLSPDGTVLAAGGSFTGKVVELDSTTGAAASGWTVPSTVPTTVYALAFTSDGTTLYLGGSGSTQLEGVNSSGTATWTPSVANGQVQAIAVSGSTVYAGGTFKGNVGANSVSRNYLAAFDSTSADATSWNPSPDSVGVDSLAVTSASVYVGGGWRNTIGSTSLPYFAVFTLSAPTVTASPTISGTVMLGSTLTCSTGTWSNSPTSYSYEWLRDGSAISGATSSTYVAASADVGHHISCQVTAVNGEGSASSTSASVSIVSTPTNSAAPTVTGTVAVGTALTCNPGTWTQSPTYAYAWLLDGKAVSGATATSYTPTSGDAGHALSCRVTGSNDAGSAVATSAAVLVPSPGSTSSSSSSSSSPPPPPAPPSSGTAVTSSVTSAGGGTLALPSLATVSWESGAFAAAGTVAVTQQTLTGNLDGFGKTGPVLSVAYTAPGASESTPVFLQSPLRIVFPASAVPTKPYVATSEDGITFTPIVPLAKDELPSGQIDGYFARSDGSIVVYTRHTSLFALLHDVQAPSRPTTLVASLRGTVLRLRWPPAVDNSRTIAYYEIVRGRAIVAKVPGSHTATGFSVARLTKTSVYKVLAVDPAGNVGQLSPGIRIVVARRPKGVPTRIPAWAQRLRAWQATPKSVRGKRPATPTPLPKWYGPWSRWVATRLSIRP